MRKIHPCDDSPAIVSPAKFSVKIAWALALPAYDEDPRRGPALRITHADGTTSTRLHVDDVERVDHGDGRAEHTIHLVDEAQPLQVSVRFRTHDDEGVLEQWVEVTNRQQGPIRLHEVAAAAPSSLAAAVTWFGRYRAVASATRPWVAGSSGWPTIATSAIGDSARSIAAVSPTGPAPTTTTGQRRGAAPLSSGGRT